MIGFKIANRTRAVSPDWVAKFRALPVANVSDALPRKSFGGARLRPYYTGGTMSGPAITVRTRPGDNLIVQKALDLAAPGDIVVVDAGGALTRAVVGGLMVAHAKQRGLGGIVVFGAIRDSAELLAGDFPVFAAGVTHYGPDRDGPGEVNTPISIDGLEIHPGDLVLGDADGVLVVPFDDLAETHAASVKKQMAEAETMEAIARDKNDRSWVDQALIKAGYVPE